MVVKKYLSFCRGSTHRHTYNFSFLLQQANTSIVGWECGWEVSFARAEGLHAHGHAREACALGVRLARELLARPPALGALDISFDLKRGRRRHAPPPRVSAASHRVSCLASATLAKCAFLCTVSIVTLKVKLHQESHGRHGSF